MAKKDECAKLCDISTVEDVAKKFTFEHRDLIFKNAATLATCIKCKNGIIPVIPTTDTASVSVPAPTPPAVRVLEKGNENNQLHSQVPSSSLNKTKRKNT